MNTIQAIADALRYPTTPPVRFEAAADFFDEVKHVDPRGLEELYTTTFDLNPVATLEVGWHLWGEQYERGRFLADLRELQARLGIDSGTELPDHLTVLLPTLERCNDDDLRAKCTQAIEKILKPLEEHGNPYRHLLRAAKEALGAVAPLPAMRGEGGAERRVRGDASHQDQPPHPAFGHLLPRDAGEKGDGRVAPLPATGEEGGAPRAVAPLPATRGEGGAHSLRSGQAPRRVRGDASHQDQPPHPAFGHLLPRDAGEKGDGIEGVAK